MSSHQHRADLKPFCISPVIREEMVAPQAKPIPVILSFQQSREQPDKGIGPSKDKIKEYLKAKGIAFRESDFFVFASLTPGVIQELADMRDLIDKIWKDELCHAHLLTSVETIKAGACWRTFGSNGKGITWAVLDTGIRSDHPH